MGRQLEKYGGRTLVLWDGKADVLTADPIPHLSDMLNIAESDIHIYDDHGHFLAQEMPDRLVS